MALIKCHECGSSISTNASACPQCGAAGQQPTSLITKLFAGFLIVGVIATIFGPSRDGTSATTQAVVPEKKTQELRDLISVKKVNWKIGGFNNIFIGTLTIENKNSVGVKDFVIECETVGASGTKLDVVRTVIYDTISSGKTRTFKDVNMGLIDSQSKRAGCEVINAQPLKN